RNAAVFHDSVRGRDICECRGRSRYQVPAARNRGRIRPHRSDRRRSRRRRDPRWLERSARVNGPNVHVRIARRRSPRLGRGENQVRGAPDPLRLWRRRPRRGFASGSACRHPARTCSARIANDHPFADLLRRRCQPCRTHIADELGCRGEQDPPGRRGRARARSRTSGERPRPHMGNDLARERTGGAGSMTALALRRASPLARSRALLIGLGLAAIAVGYATGPELFFTGLLGVGLVAFARSAAEAAFAIALAVFFRLALAVGAFHFEPSDQIVDLATRDVNPLWFIIQNDIWWPRYLFSYLAVFGMDNWGFRLERSFALYSAA